MNDDDQLSDANRRSMRILATSTKAAGPANARIADRLERAAGSGDPDDYRKAEASFDALPADERRRIGSHAEKQAVTQRKLDDLRRKRPLTPAAGRPPAIDDGLDWKPMILSHSPATDPADPPAARAPGAAAAPPPVPRAGAPRAGAARAAGVPAASGRAPGSDGGRATPQPASGQASGPAASPPRPKKPATPTGQAAASARQADSDKGWDWQRIPEDPILKASRRKAAPLDPIEELRRQMLGDDNTRR